MYKCCVSSLQLSNVDWFVCALRSVTFCYDVGCCCRRCCCVFVHVNVCVSLCPCVRSVCSLHYRVERSWQLQMHSISLVRTHDMNGMSVCTCLGCYCSVNVYGDNVLCYIFVSLCLCASVFKAIRFGFEQMWLAPSLSHHNTLNKSRRIQHSIQLKWLDTDKNTHTARRKRLTHARFWCAVR